MRPQDIVILLKKVTLTGRGMTNAQIAKELGISASEVSEALERCRIARLIDNRKQRVNILALKEFMVHGLKYVFIADSNIKYWIYGHSHRNISRLIGNTECICNQLGYVRALEHICFKKDAIILV